MRLNNFNNPSYNGILTKLDAFLELQKVLGVHLESSLKSNCKTQTSVSPSHSPLLRPPSLPLSQKIIPPPTWSSSKIWAPSIVIPSSSSGNRCQCFLFPY